MDDSMRQMIERIRKPEFWEGVRALGPLVTEEELWGLPKPGSLEWMVMKASQIRFPDPFSK